MALKCRWSGTIRATGDVRDGPGGAGRTGGLEDPAHRIEDIKAAVSFLSTRPEADSGRIGAVGICASGGYALSATAGDHRIRAVATVSAIDTARQFRNGADGTQDPAVFQQMLDAAAAARTAEARGKGPQTFQLFPDTADQARARSGQHGLEGFEYYMSGPARHARSAKFLTWSSIDHMAFFDAFRFVSLIGRRPLLMIVGREAVTSWMSVQALRRADRRQAGQFLPPRTLLPTPRAAGQGHLPAPGVASRVPCATRTTSPLTRTRATFPGSP